VVLVLLTSLPAKAQTPELPPGPIYIVQEGDTLWDIASLFNVSVDALITYNQKPTQDLYVGDQLVIPGMETLSGYLTILPVPLGETLRSLSRKNGIDPAVLVKLNRIVSPGELFAGYKLIMLQSEPGSLGGHDTLTTGDTLLEHAVRLNKDPWGIAHINTLPAASLALPSDILLIPGSEMDAGILGLPPAISTVSLDPLPLKQGQTAQVLVTLNEDAVLKGSIGDRPLYFYPLSETAWVALQGIHAMLEPGLYPFTLVVVLPDDTRQSFEQSILINDGYFLQDPVLLVEPSTIDPAVTEPENAVILSLVGPSTSEKRWDGYFQLPVDDDFCIVSMYGNRRSYNNSDFIYFHTGVDFSICSETHPFDIYAPADGIVIFSGPLTVRGNATILDHGWGVYSGFWHQEEMYVTIGESVTAGQLLGEIGSTGRVTGPHLHWEVWVNGVQVDPIEWLDKEFPH
jgi:murein DD-endopeptidase MepM/ murein hydrolase activator NlpD